jgi:hypothetical protein
VIRWSRRAGACAPAREQDSVGRQRQIRDRRRAASGFDEHRQVAAQQRLAAGDSHTIDADCRERVGDRRGLLVAEDAFTGQPDVVRLGHAVLAAQVASVGHRNAQAAQRPLKAIEERHRQE